MKANREGAARLLARLAAEYGVADRAERRSGFGNAAALIGQIAAEEAADLIVVGARLSGRMRRPRRSPRRAARQRNAGAGPDRAAAGPSAGENGRMNGGQR